MIMWLIVLATLVKQLTAARHLMEYGEFQRLSAERTNLPNAQIIGNGAKGFVNFIVNPRRFPAPATGKTAVDIQGAQWILHEKLGGGTFGQVFLATEWAGPGTPGKKVAIKFAVKDAGLYLLPELDRMENLRGIPGVPELINRAHFGGDNILGVMMVMQYYTQGDLLKFIKDKGGKLPAAEMLAMATDAFQKLKVIHETTGMHHGDIKPGNLFVDENGHIVFGDWGNGKTATKYFNVKAKQLSQGGDMASLFLSILYLDGTLTNDKLGELRNKSSIFKNWKKVLAQQLRDEGRTVWADIWDQVLKPGPEVPHDLVLATLREEQQRLLDFPTNGCTRRLSDGRHLRACRIPREYELTIDDENNGKVTTRTQDVGSTTTKSLVKETPVSGASRSRESILTVGLAVRKLASQTGDAVASMTKLEIAEAMVAAKVSPKLRRILDAIKTGFRGLVGHAEHAHRGPSSADVAPDVSTLNSGMFVLALSHVLQGMQQTHGGDPRALSNVQYALGFQMYVNLAGSALFVAADVAKFGALVELGVAQGVLKPVEEMLSVIGKVESAAGGLLSLVNVGFDIYELSEARNSIERNMAINQLVFDSAGVALIGTSTALAATGAVVASQILGAFFVPLAGLGIGVTALVGAFAKIGLQANQVGLYFGKLREGFQGGVYQLENGRYVPNPYSVIEKIDFQTLTVTMGSPYLSKSTHGSTGSGRINYFFWVGDQPRCNLRRYSNNEIMDPRMKWKKDVFDLRERMEKNGCKTCSATQRLPATSENQGELGKQNSPSVFVLPMSPRSVIGYEYFILPGATTRQDYGFQVLRDLEGDDFDFDFYVFPSEYIINHVHQYFLDTTVTLVMDDVHRFLVAPKQERGTTGAWNKLSYHIVGSTNTTEIFLQNGVNFILTSPTSNPPGTFVLDSTLMDQQMADVTIMDKKIQFDDLSIDYSALPVESHVYLRSKEGLRRLDIAGDIFLTESVNAPSNLRGSLQDVTHQVGKLTQEHRTAGRFVGVGGSIEGIKGHIVYDTLENILVYTNDPTPSDTILLGVQSKEFGCFASPSQCRVWCTNLITHEAILETKSSCSGTSGVALGSFIFVAEKRAIIEITRVGKQPSNKESLHYRYLLSENDCSLVDIRHFAPVANTPQDLHSVLSAVPQWVDTPLKIGKSTRHIVSARVADWVAYERLLHGTARAPELNQRSWYHESTNTTIILEKPKVNIPLENLTFMPLVSRTPSSRQKHPAILFHDSSSAQVFRYEPAPHGQGSGTLVLLRANIANVAQSGTAWFGVSSHGSVVEFLSAELFRIVGYTHNIFEENSLTQTHWADWWTTLQAEDKASAPIIPFYKVESGLIKATRSWYVRQANAYVILDHRFNENGTVNCVGVTGNEADALLVTETGVMWTAGVLRASDIADPSTNWKARKAPVEWTPSRHIHSEYKIVGAQWSAGVTTIETQTGLVILAHDLTTVSARFTLRGLRVSGHADNALQLYHAAQHSHLQMPRANFVPVWVGDKQAYLLNVKNPTHIRLIVPNHQGVPLGVDDIKNKMVFFDAARRVLWSDNAQLPSTFDFATRFGEVLLATSSQIQVFIPKLFGVKKIAVELKHGVQKLTVPHSYDQVNEVAVDTTNMAPTDVIEVQLPWGAEELAQSAMRDVGNVDTTLQIVVSHESNKTLRWQGLPRQRLITTFAPTGRAVSRSAVTKDDGSHGVPELIIIAGTIAAVIIGIPAFVLCTKFYRSKDQETSRRE